MSSSPPTVEKQKPPPAGTGRGLSFRNATLVSQEGERTENGGDRVQQVNDELTDEAGASVEVHSDLLMFAGIGVIDSDFIPS